MDYIRQMTQVDLVVRDDAVSYEKQVVALHGKRNQSSSSSSFFFYYTYSKS